MLCPVCNEPMIVLELNKVEIDYCSNCEGIWLDSGEIEILLESEKEKLKNFFKEDPDHSEKPYKCPICSKRMVKVHVGDTKDILIDKCLNEHGLWFDKGELKAALEFGSKGAENKVINLLKEMFESSAKNDSV
jgi:Zn-finger nucleic acid-binding protein